MKEQRFQEILRIVRAHNCVSIDTLGKELRVSPSTVRRDLDELRRRQLVLYNKNGVIPMYEMHLDASVNFRTKVNAEAKAAIGRRAASLVKSGGVLFLDSSSTALYLAGSLRGHKNLVIITNSLPVVTQLRGKDMQVILIGGMLSERSHAFYGPLAEKAMEQYNFDMAFISPVALSRQGYAAETSQNAADIRSAALRRAQCRVLLCDHTKFGLTRPYNIGHINDFNYIITDNESELCETSAVVLRA